MIDKDRGAGRTTALALKYLSEAISNPNIPIQVKDHCDTIQAHESLLGYIGRIACQLGIDDIVTNCARLTVMRRSPDRTHAYDNGRTFMSFTYFFDSNGKLESYKATEYDR